MVQSQWACPDRSSIAHFKLTEEKVEALKEMRGGWDVEEQKMYWMFVMRPDLLHQLYTVSDWTKMGSRQQRQQASRYKGNDHIQPI